MRLIWWKVALWVLGIALVSSNIYVLTRPRACVALKPLTMIVKPHTAVALPKPPEVVPLPRPRPKIAHPIIRPRPNHFRTKHRPVRLFTGTFSCAKVPAIAYRVDQATLVQYARSYGLSKAQIEKVLACIARGRVHGAKHGKRVKRRLDGKGVRERAWSVQSHRAPRWQERESRSRPSWQERFHENQATSQSRPYRRKGPSWRLSFAPRAAASVPAHGVRPGRRVTRCPEPAESFQSGTSRTCRTPSMTSGARVNRALKW